MGEGKGTTQGQGKTLKVLAIFAVCYAAIYFYMLASQPIYDLLSQAITALNLMVPIFGWLQVFVDAGLPLAIWDSPMFWLLPIPGFFFMYLLTDWAYEFFDMKKIGPNLFSIVFWGTALLSYLVVLLWYYSNNYSLMMQSNPQQYSQLGITFFVYLFGGVLTDGSAFAGMQFNFWDYWKNSAFLIFSLAAYLGWLSQRIIIPALQKRLG